MDNHKDQRSRLFLPLEVKALAHREFLLWDVAGKALAMVHLLGWELA